jgi:hypothetical protein
MAYQLQPGMKVVQDHAVPTVCATEEVFTYPQPSTLNYTSHRPNTMLYGTAGHILLNGSDVINYHGADDPLKHEFYSGPQKYISDIHIEFFYMSHGRLIPYDFRHQDHILKFEITGSTDKLESLPKVPIPEEEGVDAPSISIPEGEVNAYKWKEYLSIGIIVLVGIILMSLVRRKPKLSE